MQSALFDPQQFPGKGEQRFIDPEFGAELFPDIPFNFFSFFIVVWLRSAISERVSPSFIVTCLLGACFFFLLLYLFRL